jgi:hypothetical protein
MKALPFIFALLVSPVAFAGFNVPNTVHQLSAIEKATEEAKAKKRPIAFLLSDKNTTCPICAASSMTVMKELKSKAEVVYVESAEKGSLPESVKSGLNTTSGKGLPHVVIVDNTLSNVITAFAYDDAASFKKSVSEAEKKIRAAKTPAK